MDVRSRVSIRPIIPSFRIRSAKAVFSFAVSHLADAGQFEQKSQQNIARTTVMIPSRTKIHRQPCQPFAEWILATAYANDEAHCNEAGEVRY